jgi:hypothetical protein
MLRVGSDLVAEREFRGFQGDERSQAAIDVATIGRSSGSFD